MEDLVQGWIKAQGVDVESDKYEEVCWAIDKLYLLAHDKPLEALYVISKILVLDSSEQVVGALGSGAIEELLVHHSEAFIHDVVKMSKLDSNFQRCLNHTYLDEDDVSSEVYEIFQNHIKNN